MASWIPTIPILPGTAGGLPAGALAPWARAAVEALRPKPRASARILVLRDIESGLLSEFDSKTFPRDASQTVPLTREIGRRDEWVDYRLCSLGASNPGFSLERRTDGETERLPGFPQVEVRGDGCNCCLEAEIARTAGREHASRDRTRRVNDGVQDQRIVGVVDPEGLLDDRQKHLGLEPRRHARHKVRARNHLQVWAEGRRCRAATGTLKGSDGRTHEDRAVEPSQSGREDIEQRK